MLLGCIFLASVNIYAKYLSSTYSIPQIVWARYTFHILMLVVIFGRGFPNTLKTDHFGWQCLRSFLMIVATACYFSGLRTIELAEASAIMFLVPILVTAFSSTLLAERIGYRRWIGILVGFAGALIIIRPGTGMMQAGALFMITAAICQAFYQIYTRRVSDLDSPSTSLTYSAVGGFIVLSAIAPFFWIQPDLHAWVLMVVMGVSAGAGHFALIKAFSVAQAPTVAPYFYSHLLWATIFGFTIFGSLPDIWTLVGAAVIVTSGLYIYHREQVRKKELAKTEALKAR